MCIRDRFRDKWKCALDFDFEDAIRKLLRLGLAERDGAGYRAVGLDEAQRRLDRVWGEFLHPPPPAPADPAKPDPMPAPQRTAA